MPPRRGHLSERIMTENAGRRTDLRGQARLVSPGRQRETAEVAVYLAKPDVQPGLGVLVLHSWCGLNGVFRDLCDRPASEGSPLPASAGGRASRNGIEPSGFARSVSARHRPAGGTPAVMKKGVQS